MRWMAIAVILPLVPLAAQEEAAASKTPVELFEEMEQAYEKANKEWWAAYEAAAQDEDEAARQELLRNRVESEFVPRFWSAAEEHAGTEDAVRFLVWVAVHGYTDRDRMQAAITTLVEDHVTSPELAQVAGRIGSLSYVLGKDEVHRMLSRVVEKNAHPEVQANALMARGEMYVGTRGGDASDEQRTSALADLRRVIELTKEEGLAERAKGAIYEEENLGVGKVAPEIVAEDLDGVEFKLSDYRGKVVMLDFWGDW